MTSHKSLLIGFLSIILFTTILGLTSLYKMFGLSEITEKMYKHPFTVSKAILQIKVQTAEIRLNMEELINSKEISKINTRAIEVDSHHKSADASYKLIFERYLGNMEDIKKSYALFLEWKTIRDKVISFIIIDDYKNAKLNKKNEDNYAQKLDQLLQKIEEFANNKAISYNQNAQDSKMDSIIIISTLLFIIGVISVIIAVIVIQNSMRLNRDTQRHFYLIDQNINLAQLDLNASFVDISNSLSRLLNATKSDLIQQRKNPLLGNDEIQVTDILKTISSSKQWQGEIEINTDRVKDLWVFADIQPILDNNFQITGYTMIIDDITNKKQLEVVSVTDGMTGLFNRREFDSSFAKRIELAKREKKILVFMMLDIDHFKLYNDNYGHQHGDHALQSVAKALRLSFSRPDDVVYRLGGEEFGVLFTTDEEDGVKHMADKVLQNIENLKIKHEFSTASDYITVSIGLGIVKHDYLQNADQIYVEVDEALYRAKDGG